MRARAIAKVLATILIIPSLANGNSECVVVAKHTLSHRSRGGPLDLRFERIRLSGITMQDALLCLANSISSSTQGKVKFAFGLENSRDLMDRIPLKNPKVRLDAKNVSLAVVLDELCAQARWSYRMTPIGLMFTDSPAASRPPRRR